MTIEYTYPPQDPRYAQAMTDMARPSTASASGSLFSADGLSFKDVVDTINPLQHLPVISSLYQSATGDIPSAAAEMIGGALFGGPIGFMAAAANAGLSAATGGGVADHVMAMLDGGSASSTGTQYAAAAYQKTQNLG